MPAPLSLPSPLTHYLSARSLSSLSCCTFALSRFVLRRHWPTHKDSCARSTKAKEAANAKQSAQRTAEATQAAQQKAEAAQRKAEAKQVAQQTTEAQQAAQQNTGAQQAAQQNIETEAAQQNTGAQAAQQNTGAHAAQQQTGAHAPHVADAAREQAEGGRCAGCAGGEEGSNYFSCGACQRVEYCSRHCQTMVHQQLLTPV